MKNISDALNIKFYSDAGDSLTIREYFKELLETLWVEGEGFSGKRPFGNSGWEYDLYTPLVKNGFIEGSFDRDGYLDSFNKEDAEKFVLSLIKECFKTDNK